MTDRCVATAQRGRALEVFRASLALGLTSFGGPVAHLGYFEKAYVRERRWLSPEEYGGLVALCQLLPGPASSQVGFLIGLRRAGWAGALAAWLGFTLPSALLMGALGTAGSALAGPGFAALLHGLQLVAVAVVALAVRSMGLKLCPDRPRVALALLAAALVLTAGGWKVQLLTLALGATGGLVLCRNLLSAPAVASVSPRAGGIALALFLALFAALPLAHQAGPRSLIALAGTFYESGALVFGGGHVVLPLLRDALVPSGWLPDGLFLAGYGAAQAVPGPLFTFASYLGAAVAPAGDAVLWAAVALVALFLPGLLLALAGVPLWSWLGRHPGARGALAGINAAVVGILGAALYDPIWTSAVHGGSDVAVAVTGLLLLERWGAPPWIVVVLCVVASVLRSLIP